MACSFHPSKNRDASGARINNRRGVDAFGSKPANRDDYRAVMVVLFHAAGQPEE